MKRQKPLIAISSCLLGENIRYNGGHCRENWIYSELSKFVDFHPVCPELAMGLGVPREEIHLFRTTRKDNEVKLRSKFTKEELTQTAYITYESIEDDLKNLDIDGHIFTRKSPTCGPDNVKTITLDDPNYVNKSTGLYAGFIMDQFPNLPYIDNGRIKNIELRENFVKKIFSHFRFKQLNGTMRDLQLFHQMHKYAIMEHNQENMRTLGRIAANHEGLSAQKVYQIYFKLFMETISILPTRKNRLNACYHVFGYFKNDLGAGEKKALLNLMEDYQNGVSNYLTINSFLNVLTEAHQKAYLQDQYIFEPYPKELKLLKDIA
ncbi:MULTISPECIES: DUF523 and DUF1722 domain-containing protein [Halobacteriovorax]|uniref:DUF1722 domain-containing protein n=1 Tax=Halobacteriovorax vibrionivorans TaxID=2152716 RepID=A0ABY0IJI7_9BACT|nr:MULTISPECIES: DUF523 and DUF1722 domain-containing protein [Halobacteriovorax]RZF22263.1 DUF1722 domain-containing protein [Halobacteriovorax vibrionivorans]TGD48515.1 DUF1722 domain-containing protein [Halobacteriovorax sp. Y22]